MGLLCGLTLHLAYAIPAHATAIARALACCATHGHPVSPAQSSRCCHVVGQAGDPAVRPLERHHSGAPDLATVGPIMPLAIAAAALPSLPASAIDRFGAGPPRYIEIRVLRL